MENRYPRYINVAGPAYRGAPYPVFDPKKINESHFEDELRYKECNVEMTSENEGTVTWLAQEGYEPSKLFLAEVRRAFIANGMVDGGVISLKFGIRDNGYEGAKNFKIQV